VRDDLRTTVCFVASALILVGGGTRSARAQGISGAGSTTAAPRIVQAIDEANLATLAGNTHPLARPEFDQGAVTDSFLMDHLQLQLKRSREREQALDLLITGMHDPNSPNYHQWLSAQQFGEEFGPARQDIEIVANWLRSYGFEINSIYRSGMAIDVTGTAGQVRQAFHTEIHNYSVRGVLHIANTHDPQIPAALAPVVMGFASLHDFRPRPMMRPHPKFSFGFQGEELYDVGPLDFATIYNVTPLWTGSNPIRGAGQTVAVLEDTDMKPADWTTFRTAFGLSSYAGTFTQIHPAPTQGANNCSDPGANLDESEAALDAEWAGAAAPDAAIELASCPDTTTTSGDLIAAANLVNSVSPPPILSDSYGGCEAQDGAAGNAFINHLWQQAVAEGTSVFVAAGDEGAAECDYGQLYATHGITVDGTASTPYDVAVGGTDFQDFVDGTISTYWSTTDGGGARSVLSYVPEMTWNDSCASSALFTYEGFSSGSAFCNDSAGASFVVVDAGSGGPSSIYSKPAWQSGVVGVRADGRRDIPDVALFAADGLYAHALLYCMSDSNQGGSPCNYSKAADAWNNSAGGTSFSAPAFAGVQALINQSTGSRQGNPNFVLYRLAAIEFGSGTEINRGNLALCNANNGNQVGASCVFYDVTTGDIDLACRGQLNCYVAANAQLGVLSSADLTLKVAYPAGQGWDYATGLGSVNVANLVNSWNNTAAR
jgi:subtilase family serine protease